MVDETFGLPMEDGADLEVALEFTKCFFDFDMVFVVALDLRGVSARAIGRLVWGRYQPSWAVLAAASLERAASALAMRSSRRSQARFLRHGPPPMTWRLPLALFQ
jgi:hypothetical protein